MYCGLKIKPLTLYMGIFWDVKIILHQNLLRFNYSPMCLKVDCKSVMFFSFTKYSNLILVSCNAFTWRWVFTGQRQFVETSDLCWTYEKTWGLKKRMAVFLCALSTLVWNSIRVSISSNIFFLKILAKHQEMIAVSVFH